MLQFGSNQTLRYKLDAKKRATIAAANCSKVDNVCNVVVVFRTETVGSTSHILSCGTVSTFYIANLHSQTRTHTWKTKIIITHKC